MLYLKDLPKVYFSSRVKELHWAAGLSRNLLDYTSYYFIVLHWISFRWMYPKQETECILCFETKCVSLLVKLCFALICGNSNKILYLSKSRSDRV